MAGFHIRRGVNIGGWLSQSKLRGTERREFFTADDVAHIAHSGFDHVRLPVDEVQLWDEQGGRDPEAWELMNLALDWCEVLGLSVVLDLHVLRCHYFNAPERPLFTDPGAPGQFARLWADLSDGLGGRSNDLLAYELMNEPVADDDADWNRVYPYPYRAIREREPDRTVVLGSNKWSQAATMRSLDVPHGDPNLILTFHYYNSMLVTHYQAHFVKECAAYGDRPIQYPGRPIPDEILATLDPELREAVAKWNGHHDAEVMQQDLAPPLELRSRTGLPLYCGEFGIMATNPASIRRAWTSDIRSVLESNDISWAAWSYKGRKGSGFNVFDASREPTPVYEGLMGRRSDGAVRSA